jgi:hypothetical protein
LRQSPGCRSLPPMGLERRPLPSTGVTRRPRYYEPHRHPGRPGLSLTGVRLRVTRPRRSGLPVLLRFPHPGMPSSLPRWARWDGSLVVRPIPASPFRQRWQPSPCQCRVGAHINRFEACSTFTRVTACLIAGPPCGPLSRRLRRLRYLHRRSDSFRLERPSCRGAWLPLEIRNLSRRTTTPISAFTLFMCRKDQPRHLTLRRPARSGPCPRSRSALQSILYCSVQK